MRNINSEQIYDSFMHGADWVIKNKEELNDINVFPVRDGDTGSNLASLMHSIIRGAETKKTVKETLESIADAALIGARGNSGIIFSQYLISLSKQISLGKNVTVEQYAMASSAAVEHVYLSIQTPVEGTIITVMREWGLALVEESQQKKSIEETFDAAYVQLEKALEKTKDQLEVLKKANVVDAGAKGFTRFIEGIIHYIKNRIPFDQVHTSKTSLSHKKILKNESHHNHDKFRYCTECLIEGVELKPNDIKEALKFLGESLVVVGNKRICRVHIHSNSPSEIFEYLHTIGDVIFQKIDDMQLQSDVLANRKSNVAILTDSIADLPDEYIREHQIHVINLEILHGEKVFLDKLTITPSTLMKLSRESDVLPTSSQPNPKTIQNVFDYLSSHYESVIVITVSKELSGTYNTFISAANTYIDKHFKISIINSKLNSGAQGLIVNKCVELLKQELDHISVVNRIEAAIEESKILVQVQTLDNMIKSGRLSTKAGFIAKKIGLKPIVTLDGNGKGTLQSISLSLDKSDRKLIKHIKKLLKKRVIEVYSIVHVNNIEGAEKLSDITTRIIGMPPLYISETSSIVAVGAGEGAIAISYILKEEVQNVFRGV